jgi:hypothetical protein
MLAEGGSAVLADPGCQRLVRGLHLVIGAGVKGDGDLPAGQLGRPHVTVALDRPAGREARLHLLPAFAELVVTRECRPGVSAAGPATAA